MSGWVDPSICSAASLRCMSPQLAHHDGPVVAGIRPPRRKRDGYRILLPGMAKPTMGKTTMGAFATAANRAASSGPARRLMDISCSVKDWISVVAGVAEATDYDFLV